MCPKTIKDTDYSQLLDVGMPLPTYNGKVADFSFIHSIKKFRVRSSPITTATSWSSPTITSNIKNN